MRSRKLLLGALSVAFFVFCFQGVSLLAKKYQEQGAMCNGAGPFGLPINFWLLGGAFLSAAGFFFWQWWQEERKNVAFFWLLLLAAGMSNLLERLFFGCVFDFLRIPWLPLFNVADVVLSLSVIFLLWWELRRS